MAEKKVMKQTVPKELSANVFKTFNRMTAENKRTLTFQIVESLSKSKKGFIDYMGNVVISESFADGLIILSISADLIYKLEGKYLKLLPKPRPYPKDDPCPSWPGGPIMDISKSLLRAAINQSVICFDKFRDELQLTTLTNNLSQIKVGQGLVNIMIAKL